METTLSHYFSLGLDVDPDYVEPDALSSPGLAASSSPCLEGALDSEGEGTSGVAFLELDYPVGHDSDDMEDDNYIYEPRTPVKPRRRQSPLSNADKTRLTLDFIRDSFSHFSTLKFMRTMFAAQDPAIKASAGMFISEGGPLEIMELWWGLSGGFGNQEMVEWVVAKAEEVCYREASLLSERASRGPHAADAKFLCVSAKNVTVQMIKDFRLYNLTARYERATPVLQRLLKAVIGKLGSNTNEGTRNPDAGRTLITSMLLNLRSRKINYHAIINSFMLWDNRVPKRLVQAFNHFAITTSYPSQARSVTSLSKDCIEMARRAANHPENIIMLPYDNFNWTARAWESSALHGSVTHDEVSALLVILPKPLTCHKSTREIVDIASFKATEGTRHKINPSKALIDIMPSFSDQSDFRENAIIHVQTILAEEIKELLWAAAKIPQFFDSQALPFVPTEDYYLPTFDQEQGSTRGNMVVLEHYFGKVLQIPMAKFEDTMFVVLGDRLTTVRDRAAQDQRAVDRSSHRFDHLSSFSMVSGLMHFSLNFINAVGGNTWGESGESSPVSLLIIRDLLPNRGEINLRKVDYYGWLRFLDVILRSLVIKAMMTTLNIKKTEDLSKSMAGIKTIDQFYSIAAQIVDSFLLPSVNRLEALGIKSLKGNTHCGQAVLLMHDLMTLREMQHAIKHGHPERIRRMIKYWMPMFYAAGSYNYANECMQILHNHVHDWPSDFAQTAFNGMLVNPSGKAARFKPTDIRVEHLNDKIKERAHGSNATPDILEKTTPAMGVVQNMTDQLFEDIGVEQQNQYHASVSQHKDVEILTRHFTKSNIFDFAADKLSSHNVVDLYRTGSIRLAGKHGGHAKHLARHVLRLRRRHGDVDEPSHNPPDNDELDLATDSTIIRHTNIETLDSTLQDLVSQSKVPEEAEDSMY